MENARSRAGLTSSLGGPRRERHTLAPGGFLGAPHEHRSVSMNEVALDIALIVTGLLAAAYGYLNAGDPDYDKDSGDETE